MLKGSFSLSRLRWFDDVVDVFDLECQKVGFSWCGDGCRNCQPCLRHAHAAADAMHPFTCICDGFSGKSYWQVYAAVVDLYLRL